MNFDDREFVAMQELYRLLKPFDRGAQERITCYVGARLAAESSDEDQRRWMAMQKECAVQQDAQFPVPPLNYAIGRL